MTPQNKGNTLFVEPPETDFGGLAWVTSDHRDSPGPTVSVNISRASLRRISRLTYNEQHYVTHVMLAAGTTVVISRKEQP